MKKVIYFTIPFIMLATACDDLLETNPTDFYTQDTFWQTPQHALEGLTGAYNVLLVMYGDTEAHMWEVMSPNAFNYTNWSSSNDFARGVHSGTTLGINTRIWDEGYTGVGRCNTVIDKVQAMDFDEDLKTRIIGEAKFLRAYYYDKMNVVFGGVPLILSTPNVAEHSNLPRNTHDEVLTQILEDLNAAAAVLPLSYPEDEGGRATKGAALALKARILLQNHRYEDVVSAIDEIFALNVYALFPDYNGLFRKANEGNSEIIFDVRFNAPEIVNEYDIIMAEWSTQAPLKSLIDQYQMVDGKSIQESGLYDPANPYNDRDPRFAQSVLYLGAPWRGGVATTSELPYTGYSFIKYTEYNADTEGTITDSDVNYVIIRYADVLLMYAEAMNELNGPSQEVYDAINEIRRRPTVEMPDLPPGLSQEEMRQAIRLERRIELAGEASYFYDIRRWGTIEDEMVGPILNHAGEVIQTRDFDPARDYLWPIPFTEIDLNPNLVQNPGY